MHNTYSIQKNGFFEQNENNLLCHKQCSSGFLSFSDDERRPMYLADSDSVVQYLKAEQCLGESS